MPPKERRQRTTEMPLGDALWRYVHVVLQARKLPVGEKLDRLLRERDALREALNGFVVDVQFACRFEPGMGGFSAIPDADDDGDVDALDILRFGAERACWGVVKSKPTPPPSPKRPAQPKRKVKT